MTTFYLSRHGETVWHAENRYAGSTDIDMTGRGHAQAGNLARWAAQARPDAVYSSDLSRAVATAEPAAAALGLVPAIDARLREVHFGRGEGLTRTQMHESFPRELAAFLASPATVPLPGGEPGTDAVDRALAALQDIARTHPEGRVLIVMHTTLMRLLLCSMLGIDPDTYRSVFPQVINASITELHYTDNNWSLHGFNLPTG